MRTVWHYVISESLHLDYNSNDGCVRIAVCFTDTNNHTHTVSIISNSDEKLQCEYEFEGGVDIYTEFDNGKKTIHIFAQMGCCSHIETWCEMVSDYEFDVPKIQVVRREDVDYTADGYVVATNYIRVDGEQKNVSSIRKKCNS